LAVFEKKTGVKASEFWGILPAFLHWLLRLFFYLFGFIFGLMTIHVAETSRECCWLYHFVSCVTGLGLLFGSLLDMSERAGLFLVSTSIPLFLLTGIAWPIQAMPLWIQGFTWLLPSTHAVQLFIQLNQMGTQTYFVLPKLIF
jgi:ABC-2 type transport system permease protein